MARRRKSKPRRAPKRVAKRKITRSFKRKSPAKKAVKRALKDNKVTKKEIRTIVRKGGSRKQVQSIRKAAKNTKGLKIGKGVDNKKEVRKIFKRNKNKGKADNLRSDQLKLTRTSDGGGGGGTSGGGGGNSGGNGGGDGKGNGGKKGVKVTADALSGGYGHKDFERRETKLKQRARGYANIYGGENKQSRKFLKALADQATTRMKIKPSEYGRKGKKAKFSDLSLAQQYDRNSAKLEKKLSNPMNSFMEKQAKKYNSGDGPMAYLSAFKNKANPEFAEFNASRMQKFAQSGLTGKGKGTRKMRRLATNLGISDKRFEKRRNPGKVFGMARNNLQKAAKKNKNYTLGKASERLDKIMSGKMEPGRNGPGRKVPGRKVPGNRNSTAMFATPYETNRSGAMSIVPYKNRKAARKAAKRKSRFPTGGASAVIAQAYSSV